MKSKFVVTKDEQCKEELIDNGCKLITTYKDNGENTYVLTNTVSDEFSMRFSNKKVMFTNRLML